MPDLILYRRHIPACPHRKRGRVYIKCKCPVWCDGRVEGERINHSMKTRDWDRAERRMLSGFDPGALADKKMTLAAAVDSYLADCAARQLRASTITSYTNTLHDMKEFGDARGIKHVDQITLETLGAFRMSRKARDGEAVMRPASLRKELEHLRVFCKFCIEREWLKYNPAKAMKPPRESDPPTLPFEQEEVDRITRACGQIDNPNRASAARSRKRVRAAVLLMLYSGMRISDVATLDRGKLNPKTGKLLVRTMKTGTPLYVKLPESAVAALGDLPVESQRYFFWSGNGKPASVIGSLRRSIDCVLRLAKVEGHPHRFRDTFAVRLLENDTPIRTVQLLLGHSSVQTTERHYAPFVHSQQKLLDAATEKLDFGESSHGLREEVVEHRLGNAQRRILSFPA